MTKEETEYLVIPRSTLETALRATKKAHNWAIKLGASDSFINGVHMGLIALESIKNASQPLEEYLSHQSHTEK